jgi:hypothetical protein
MDNSYFTQVAPYFQQQDQGLMPVFQNIAQQQANQNAALAQQNQQVAQAGQVKSGGGMGGLNPMAMAAALRGKGGNSIMDRASNYFGTQQSPQMQSEINQLGSNTWNPMSNYYTGANGWGSYGE